MQCLINMKEGCNSKIINTNTRLLPPLTFWKAVFYVFPPTFEKHQLPLCISSRTARLESDIVHEGESKTLFQTVNCCVNNESKKQACQALIRSRELFASKATHVTNAENATVIAAARIRRFDPLSFESHIVNGILKLF